MQFLLAGLQCHSGTLLVTWKCSQWTSPFASRSIPAWASRSNTKRHSHRSNHLASCLQAERTWRICITPWPAALHHSMACRTIIAVARNGRLREVILGGHLEKPFAIRALLPYLIGVDKWDLWDLTFPGWLDAASLLRRLLFHASLWLSASILVVPRYDRRLTRQDIQSLAAHFKKEGLPDLLSDEVAKQQKDPTAEGSAIVGEYRKKAQVIKSVIRYLPWLTEDGELAQRVADAWNAVLKRGMVDKLRCCCDRCKNEA